MGMAGHGGCEFPMEQDSPGKQVKGTDVPSLSKGKGTTEQAQNLAMGWDRKGF